MMRPAPLNVTWRKLEASFSSDLAASGFDLSHTMGEFRVSKVNRVLLLACGGHEAMDSQQPARSETRGRHWGDRPS